MPQAVASSRVYCVRGDFPAHATCDGNLCLASGTRMNGFPLKSLVISQSPCTCCRDREKRIYMSVRDAYAGTVQWTVVLCLERGTGRMVSAARVFSGAKEALHSVIGSCSLQKP
jgi:hypothetical protein